MPELTNNERIIILGQALYTKSKWKKPLANLLGTGRWVIQRWARCDREPTDQAVCKVLKVAKAKRDEMDAAIKRVTLYPWIT